MRWSHVSGFDGERPKMQSTRSTGPLQLELRGRLQNLHYGSTNRFEIEISGILPFFRYSLAVQGRAKKILLSSVTHVPSRLMGCALAALVSWQKEGGKIQTCRNFFARPCTCSHNDSLKTRKGAVDSTRSLSECD